MKMSTTLKFCIFGLMFMFALSASAQTKKAGAGQARKGQPAANAKDLKFPPLRDFKVPEPVRFELPNGMIVFLLEDRELPVVNLTALIRTGGRWDPANKVGLADIASAVMRTGGTASKSGDQIDDELERIAASVETGAGRDFGSASMSVLREDLDTGLKTLADVLRNPAFPQDKIDLEKIQHRDGIARRNDNIQGIVGREFNKLIYGPTSPYARTEEYELLDNIKREDLIEFHKRYYHPNNMIVAVWGDFRVDEMKAKFQSYFGDWPRTEVNLPPIPEANYQAKGRIYFVQRDNVNQSNIAIGHLAGKQSDPDFFALAVMDGVLGGGFGGRFFRNIRSDQGLAYSAAANWGAGLDVPGTLYLGGQTKSESTVKFIKAVLVEIEKISTAEVTDEELSYAKESILNSFIFNFDTTGEVVNRLLNLEYYGYPKDFLQRYKENVEKVTKADVLRVAKQYIKSDKFVFMVAGKAQDFDAPLSSLGLGEVAAVDIAIPEPKASPVKEATAETIAKGRSILQAAQKAMGGDALKQVKELSTKIDGKLITPQGEFQVANEVAIKFPNKIQSKLKLPFGEIVQSFDGQNAWVKTPQGVQDMPAEFVAELQNQIAGDTVSLLSNFEGDGYQTQFIEETTFNDRKVNLVLVTTPNKHPIKVYIDAETNMVIGKSSVSKAGGAPSESEESFSDFREVGGLRLPFKSSVKRNGKLFAEATTTEVKINPGIDDQIFVKK